jgi:hypothetical protein
MLRRGRPPTLTKTRSPATPYAKKPLSSRTFRGECPNRLKSDFLSVCVLFTSLVHAGIITENTDPLLTGASVITFSEVSVETANPTIAGVSFVGIGGNIFTSSYDIGDPPSLSNSSTLGNVAIDGIDFNINFSTPVGAVGSYFAAINRPVTLQAFNGGTLLGSTSFDPGGPSIQLFRGLGGFSSEITRASVTIAAQDIIIIDDFHFQPIPEPASAGLIALVSGGIYFTRRFFVV